MIVNDFSGILASDFSLWLFVLLLHCFYIENYVYDYVIVAIFKQISIFLITSTFYAVDGAYVISL